MISNCHFSEWLGDFLNLQSFLSCKDLYPEHQVKSEIIEELK